MKSSFPRLLLGGLFLALAACPGWTVDHNNVDANRPLDFDDAETVAYREKSFEVGAVVVAPKGRQAGVEGEAELLYGFAHNWHLNVGINPKYASESGDARRFDVGDLSVGLQHNFNRETSSSPAFGVRLDATLPTGRDSSGTDFRLRGIASRHVGAYGRVHLNLDLGLNNSPNEGKRRTLPGVILGYSAPLGYPRKFNRTWLAQVGLRAAPLRNDAAILDVGVGLRQQVTPRSVFDVGIKTDLTSDSSREALRLTAGYSTAF